MSSLFRKEALDHSQNRLYGEVVLLQPLSVSVLVFSVVIICAFIIAMLFWGTYARKETVRGYLVPDKGIVKIYAPNAGSVSQIHIREGDNVTENQPLIILRTERSLQGGSDIDSLLLVEMESAKAHHYQRIESEKALLRSEQGRIQKNIEGAEKELNHIQESIATQAERLAILKTRVDGAKKLLQQESMSQVEYQKQKEEMLVQKQQLQELERGKISKENALIQYKVELVQVPIRTETRISEIEDMISEINQRSAEVLGRKIYEVRSPINGRISSLQAKLGQYQGSNLPLLAVIPDNAILQAELFVPTRAIGFLEAGQTVRVRFDAFPYQRYGIFEGEIKTISKHVLLPSELPIPLELKEAVYTVIVTLDQQDVMAYGQHFSLQAGMSLEADIILDRQTLFEWILDPLFSLKGRF